MKLEIQTSQRFVVILVTLIGATIAGEAAGKSAALPHDELICSRESSGEERSRQVRVKEEFRGEAVYRSSGESGRSIIWFNFENARSAPTAAIKIEYAIACLEALGSLESPNEFEQFGSDEVCEAVRFLRRRNYYTPGDVAEMEDILFESSPKHRNWINKERWNKDALSAAIKCY